MQNLMKIYDLTTLHAASISKTSENLNFRIMTLHFFSKRVQYNCEYWRMWAASSKRMNKYTMVLTPSLDLPYLLCYWGLNNLSISEKLLYTWCWTFNTRRWNDTKAAVLPESQNLLELWLAVTRSGGFWLAVGSLLKTGSALIGWSQSTSLNGPLLLVEIGPAGQLISAAVQWLDRKLNLQKRNKFQQ